MPEPIFCQSRHEYQSYSDYFNLVRLSGFPLIYMDEIDPDSDNTYIFSTPQTYWHDGTERRGWESPRARIIFYNLEWYEDVDYGAIPGVEVWSPDKRWADRIGAKYVPMGSHPNLVGYWASTSDDGQLLKSWFPPEGSKALTDAQLNAEKKYDAVTLWAPSYRRYHGQSLLIANGINIAPNGWGSDRDDILTKSRSMVYVHQKDGLPTVAPQRWCLAAAYRLPMITETLADGGIFTANYRLMSDLEHIGEFTRTWLLPENARILADYGHSLHRLLCEHYTFRKGIESNL